jgi:hypothetical protein
MQYGSFQSETNLAEGAVSPWKPASRPEWVSAVNELGRDLEAGGLDLVRLDADSLLEQAATKTHLADFGDDAFLEPLHILTKSLEEEANLNLIGRIIARDEILSGLVSRLAIVDVLKRHPEILDQEIKAPVFIGGAGRTGTTILQELLAEDPAHRTLLGWEVREPCPPAGESTAAREERIDRADRAISIWHRVTPESESMHAVGGRLPAECPVIFSHEFRATYFTFSYNVPSYSQWFNAADKRPAYEYHKKFLKVLQWQQPAKRWILKTATHIADVETLLEVYPDACIINTHRDPLKIVASLAGFHGTMIWMRSDQIPDVRGTMQATSLGLASLLDHTLQLRLRGVLPDDIIFDLLYAELMKDPVAAIGRIYAHFGWSFTDEAQSRMRAYLESHKQGSRGRYVYSFDNAGLDPAEERRRFSAYQDHYAVASEI